MTYVIYEVNGASVQWGTAELLAAGGQYRLCWR